jgi:hypothetical protein
MGRTLRFSGNLWRLGFVASLVLFVGSLGLLSAVAVPAFNNRRTPAVPTDSTAGDQPAASATDRQNDPLSRAHQRIPKCRVISRARVFGTHTLRPSFRHPRARTICCHGLINEYRNGA